MEILFVDVEMMESIGTNFFLTSIDVPEEMKIRHEDIEEGNDTNVGNNDKEYKRVVSWDLERDSIIQTNVNQATGK